MARRKDRAPSPRSLWQVYHAEVRYSETGRHLIIRRCDGRPVRCGWDTLQKIKNEMLGPDVRAVEVFPEVSDVVNEVNWRHLWECVVQFPLHAR
ncbi:MAG: hypothetical protein IPO08_22750 [Xanthomonadales bacterium]|nr:hypothetical protein [Xanthomonadales bacterium]